MRQCMYIPYLPSSEEVLVPLMDALPKCWAERPLDPSCWKEASCLLYHLHYNSFIAYPERVILCADVFGRLKLCPSINQT